MKSSKRRVGASKNNPCLNNCTSKNKQPKGLKKHFDGDRTGRADAYTTKTRFTELETEIDGLQAKILQEKCKLQNQVDLHDIMEYLTYGARENSPQVLIDILVNKIELYNVEIVIYFNYSDKNKPEDTNTETRDFLLPCGYNAIATMQYLVVIKKTK